MRLTLGVCAPVLAGWCTSCRSTPKCWLVLAGAPAADQRRSAGWCASRPAGSTPKCWLVLAGAPAGSTPKCWLVLAGAPASQPDQRRSAGWCWLAHQLPINADPAGWCWLVWKNKNPPHTAYAGDTDYVDVLLIEHPTPQGVVSIRPFFHSILQRSNGVGFLLHYLI